MWCGDGPEARLQPSSDWSFQTDELRSRVRYDLLVAACVSLAVVDAFFAFCVALLLINLGWRSLCSHGVLISGAALSHVLCRVPLPQAVTAAMGKSGLRLTIVGPDAVGTVVRRGAYLIDSYVPHVHV